MTKREQAKADTAAKRDANWRLNPDLPSEKWTPITAPANCGDWSISTEGRVRNRVTGWILKQMRDPNRRMFVNLGQHRAVQVKKLVVTHWMSERPTPEHRAVYLTDDVSNNSLSNLKWMAPDELIAKQRSMALARPRVMTDLANRILREYGVNKNKTSVAYALDTSLVYVRRVIQKAKAKGLI